MPGERPVVGQAEGAAQLAAAGAAQPVVGDGARVDVAALGDDSAPRIRPSSVVATSRSLRPLLRASCSIACSVWSRVSSRSAANAGEASISRVSTLVAATMSGQSASLIERSDVIALLTLRLSAACAAGSARLDLGEVRRDAIEPVEVARVRGRAVVLQLLRHLRQERLADAALVEQREDGVELLEAVGLDPVAAQVGDLARRLVGRRRARPGGAGSRSARRAASSAAPTARRASSSRISS